MRLNLCSLIKNQKKKTTLEPIPKVHFFFSNQLKNKIIIMQVIMYHIHEDLRNTGKCVRMNVLLKLKKKDGNLLN